MTYYSVRIEGRSRKTRFAGSRKIVYKKLHALGYVYDRKRLYWKRPETTEYETEEEVIYKPETNNVLLLISVGDYKHVKFDVIIKRVFSAEDFKNCMQRSRKIDTAHERIRNETIDMAARLLRSNGHFGLASMLESNNHIDYVVGGEYTWTSEQPSETTFTRFEIRGEDRLKDILSKRKIQKKIDDDNKD